MIKHDLQRSKVQLAPPTGNIEMVILTPKSGMCINVLAHISEEPSLEYNQNQNSLYPEVVLYLYKSTIRPCMEYCWLVLLAATWNC